MDQPPNQEVIAWIVGGLIAGIGAVVAAIKRTKARLSTGAKVDDVMHSLDDFKKRLDQRYDETHELFRTYAQDNARLLNEHGEHLIELKSRASEHNRRLDEHGQRIVRLEDRIPPR